MHIKKLISAGLILTFLSLILPLPLKAYELPDQPKEEPRLFIAKDTWIPEFSAGEKISLSIPIENLSSASARDVTVSISKSDDLPFQTDKMSLTQFAYSVSGNSRSIFSFKLFIPPTVKPGTYPINVHVSYRSDTGNSGSASETVYIKIVNRKKAPSVKFLGVDYEKDALPAGKSSLIKLKLQNDSDFLIKDLELKLEGFTPNGINLDKWPETQFIKTIEPGKIKLVEYRLMVDSKMESGTQALTLNMSYKDEYEGTYTDQAKVYLPVKGKGENDDELTPRIILENYDFPYYIEAGQEFPLTLSFFNTSPNKAVKNIKITLNSENQAFMPVGSSNTIYISEIGPEQHIEKTLTLKTKFDTESKIYSLNLNINYQDNSGAKLTEEEMISIPIEQETILNISSIELPQEIYAGSPISLSVDFYNMGRSLIRNLLVKIEGNFDVQDGTLFIGNLEPGKSNYYDATIFPREEGATEGKIIFTYEDNGGRNYTVEKPFKLNVMAAPEPPPMPEPEFPPQEKGTSKNKKLLTGGGILTLIFISGIVIYRRRKKRKKLEEVDIDEEL
ncbi:hypothetical protein [Thermosyntropha sp.]|uniref:COG1361 S-layer family protein n=1 Tax=Thermosyntropha sp. TaxID=2740820 RepID=UPI0025F443D9|nr:hypothetical protein [Thermosyntropha sp.]MBO8158996.1 hypothetical protein [Thermosyntropha sp.]